MDAFQLLKQQCYSNEAGTLQAKVTLVVMMTDIHSVIRDNPRAAVDVHFAIEISRQQDAGVFQSDHQAASTQLKLNVSLDSASRQFK